LQNVLIKTGMKCGVGSKHFLEMRQYDIRPGRGRPNNPLVARKEYLSMAKALSRCFLCQKSEKMRTRIVADREDCCRTSLPYQSTIKCRIPTSEIRDFYLDEMP
jgi:hypothetical protein